MQRQTTYSVMLQIPVSYLKPSERVCRAKYECAGGGVSVYFRQQRIYVNRRYKLSDGIIHHRFGTLKNLNQN